MLSTREAVAGIVVVEAAHRTARSGRPGIACHCRASTIWVLAVGGADVAAMWLSASVGTVAVAHRDGDRGVGHRDGERGGRVGEEAGVAEVSVIWLLRDTPPNRVWLIPPTVERVGDLGLVEQVLPVGGVVVGRGSLRCRRRLPHTGEDVLVELVVVGEHAPVAQGQAARRGVFDVAVPISRSACASLCDGSPKKVRGFPLSNGLPANDGTPRSAVRWSLKCS